MNFLTNKLITKLRQIFGIIFPVFYSLLLLALLVWFYNYGQTEQVNKNKKLWLDKANLLLASLQGTHKAEHLLRNAGNDLANRLEKAGKQALTPTVFLNSFNHHFNLPFMGGSITWAFTMNNGQAKALSLNGFEKTRHHALQKVFENLVIFSTNQVITTAEINRREKFVKNVFGQWSAPLHMGENREGDITPVRFSGQNYYLYWRKFAEAGQAFGGIIALVPEQNFNNVTPAMQKLAADKFIDSSRTMAAAFVPSSLFKESHEIILPEIFATQPQEKLRIKKLLRQVKQLPSSLENQIQKIEDMVFLRGLFALNSIYDAIIFAPEPGGFSKHKFPLLKAVIFIFVFWFFIYLYCFYKTGRFGLPLKFSFRLLFVISGLLPTALMILSGNNFIDEVYTAELLDLQLESTARIRNLNERSDTLKPAFGKSIATLLNKEVFQRRFANKKCDELQEIFTELRQILKGKQIYLSYLFASAPGEKSSIYLADERKKSKAELLCNFYATSVYEGHKGHNKLSQWPDIVLNKQQKGWYPALSSIGESFMANLFADVLEEETFFNLGDGEPLYFYGSIVAANGEIKKYLLFAANVDAMFRKFLQHELNSINIDSSNVFLAAEERKNSDFTIFPFKKMNVLNSRAGKKAFSFLKHCRDSIFPRTLVSSERIFVYYPLSKMPKYACGCVIDLTDANLARDKKKLLLYAFGILLLCAIYVLASLATAHILTPLGKIGKGLASIAQGQLNFDFRTQRNDEIGRLSKTLQLMVKGFKRRIKLGKYVSATLEKSLKDISADSDLQEPKSFFGTILFSDIRSFTTISETEKPEAVAEMLNLHLAAMAKEIQRFNGQIEQFIGDAVVAVFPENVKGPDSRLAALNAAISMRSAHLDLQKKRQAAGKFSYEIGIGLESGTLMAGTVRTHSRSEFIILGEARSQAEKYESLSRNGLFSRIVVSKNFNDFKDKSFQLIELQGTNCYEIKI